MIKAALIFSVVTLVPLLMAMTRFKGVQSDTEIQITIKKSMKQTQLVIACIFGSSALILAILSFLIQDSNVANIVIVALYIVSMLSSVSYAIIRQMKLQKHIREYLKK